MLNCTEEYFSGNYRFLVFGTEMKKTQCRKFLDDLPNQVSEVKLPAILKAIDTNPLLYSHLEKFKPLKNEKGVYEIKIHQVRIACVWDPKPINLIAIYGFTKKKEKWPPRHLERMRSEKDKYFRTRKKQYLEKPINELGET